MDPDKVDIKIEHPPDGGEPERDVELASEHHDRISRVEDHLQETDERLKDHAHDYADREHEHPQYAPAAAIEEIEQRLDALTERVDDVADVGADGVIDIEPPDTTPEPREQVEIKTRGRGGRWQTRTESR